MTAPLLQKMPNQNRPRMIVLTLEFTGVANPGLQENCRLLPERPENAGIHPSGSGRLAALYTQLPH
jgi:hypothetical protein